MQQSPFTQAVAGTLAVAPAQGWCERVASSPVVLKTLAGILIVLGWEILVRVAAPDYVARPSGIVAVFPEVVSSGAFLKAAASTVSAIVLGLLVAFVFGTITGLAMGRMRIVDWSLRYYAGFFFALPMVAILPLMTLWFGYTADARFAIIVYAAFLSITINAADGAKSVPIEYLEVARSFRARWHHVLFGITLLSSVPYLFAGVRLAAARGLVAAVVAEFFTGLDGLGYYILFNSRIYKHDEAFVAVLLLVVVALAFEIGINTLARRFMPWLRR